MDALLFSSPDLEEAAPYLDTIRSFSVLTALEERTLIETAQSGDEDARSRFLEHNLRLVSSIARGYIGQGAPLIDLVQEGNIGLMHALDKFDTRRGLKFSTYATWWIKQAIQRYLNEYRGLVRLPDYIATGGVRGVKEAERQLAEAGIEPTAEAVAQQSGLTLERVVDIRRWMRPIFSLDMPLNARNHSHGDEEVFLADILVSRDAPVDEQADDALLSEKVQAALSCLSPRERLVIALRFGIGEDGAERTLLEVSKHLSLSRERVRQIEVKALLKLRRALAGAQESEAVG